MINSKPFISKSRYLHGLQCHQLLWAEYNARELIPPTDPATQALFDQGKEVGELAKKLYPNGIEVEGEHFDYTGLVEKTRNLLHHRLPLFEATFHYKDAYSRSDIFVPVGDNEWDIIEVKSAGEVKDVNLDDVSLQYYICKGLGLSIRKCYVMHINKEYVRQGEIDPAQLLTKADVTSEVLELVPCVEANLAAMQKAIAGPKPENGIGPQCKDPYECSLRELCWRFLPEDNLFTLYRLPDRKAFEHLENGILSIRDLPMGYQTTPRRMVQIKAVRTGEIQVDKDGIRKFLDQLEYPLYFLDFETIHGAIPRYDGVRPFRHVPFQFSLHIVESEGANLQQHSFLANGLEDPRPELLPQLKALLGNQGSIIVYNASFERGRLKESCDQYQDYKEWYEGIETRIVDLLKPFSDFFWYHRDQRGSASMKIVLPLLTGLRYDGMGISDGEFASTEFQRVTFGETTEEEQRKVRKDLEEYCAQDTYGMVKMVEELRRGAG